MEKVIVKIADYRIAGGPSVLVTYGLGSCLAIVLYDPGLKVAGMGHIMLPQGQMSRTPGNPKKFADLCIDEMFRELQEQGCNIKELVV